jgi:hypothetical protein
VEQRQEAQKKAMDAQMSPIEKEGEAAKKKEAAKAPDEKAEDDAAPRKKPPTLLRPGEKLGEIKQ